MLKPNPQSELAQQTAVRSSSPRAERAGSRPPRSHPWGRCRERTEGGQGGRRDQCDLRSLRLASPPSTTGLPASLGCRYRSGQSWAGKLPFSLSPSVSGGFNSKLPGPRAHFAGQRIRAPQTSASEAMVRHGGIRTPALQRPGCVNTGRLLNLSVPDSSSEK